MAPLYAPSSYTLNIVVVDSDNETLQSETSVTVLVVGDITCLLSLSVDSPLMFDEDQIDPGDTVTTVSSNSTCSDSDDIAYEITEQILEDSQGNGQMTSHLTNDATNVNYQSIIESSRCGSSGQMHECVQCL